MRATDWIELPTMRFRHDDEDNEGWSEWGPAYFRVGSIISIYTHSDRPDWCVVAGELGGVTVPLPAAEVLRRIRG